MFYLSFSYDRILRDIINYFSLGVEPVDHDVMKRPPRQAKESMVNLQLLSQVFSSALVIVAGTLFVFWREVSSRM